MLILHLNPNENFLTVKYEIVHVPIGESSELKQTPLTKRRKMYQCSILLKLQKIQYDSK